MSLQIAFWVIYLVALLLSVYLNRAGDRFRTWAPSGLVYFLLIGILGWAVFGAAIHK